MHEGTDMKFLQNIFLTLVSIVAGICIIVAYTCGMVVTVSGTTMGRHSGIWK